MLGGNIIRGSARGDKMKGNAGSRGDRNRNKMGDMNGKCLISWVLIWGNKLDSASGK